MGCSVRVRVALLLLLASVPMAYFAYLARANVRPSPTAARRPRPPAPSPSPTTTPAAAAGEADARDLYGDRALAVGLGPDGAGGPAPPACRASWRGPVAVAGLFNTGTHLLAEALGRNCAPRGGVVPQVPWGKHNPVQWRDDYDDYSAPASRALNASRVLPVVTVQDPLVWMRSMCGNTYARGWLRRRGGARGCPRLVRGTAARGEEAAGEGVEIAFRKDRHVTYRSLVEMWNEW